MNTVLIKRQWNDWRCAEVPFEKIEGFHWSATSGGVRARAPQPFIHGYVSCADITGEFGHSCRHGQGPHCIKVCITRKDNTEEVWAALVALAGPKPKAA